MAISKINISVLHEFNNRNYRHNIDKHRKIVGFAIMFDGISVYVMFGHVRVCATNIRLNSLYMQFRESFQLKICISDVFRWLVRHGCTMYRHRTHTTHNLNNSLHVCGKRLTTMPHSLHYRLSRKCRQTLYAIIDMNSIPNSRRISCKNIFSAFEIRWEACRMTEIEFRSMACCCCFS